MGTFTMKVRRSIEGGAAAAPAAPAAAAAAPAAAATPSMPYVVTTADGPGAAEESVDESMVYVTAPKVGLAAGLGVLFTAAAAAAAAAAGAAGAAGARAAERVGRRRRARHEAGPR
jgi:hypothetical protein